MGFLRILNFRYQGFFNAVSELLQVLSDPSPGRYSSAVQCEACWYPPPINSSKINCDAAVKGAAAAVCCVIRDIAQVRWWNCLARGVVSRLFFSAECLAIHEACMFCAKAGVREVTMEGDNHEVIRCCQEGALPFWDCISSVKDIKFLAAKFNLSFAHVGRGANKLQIGWLAQF